MDLIDICSASDYDYFAGCNEEVYGEHLSVGHAKSEWFAYKTLVDRLERA